MDLSKDLHDWTNKLNDNEGHFISHLNSIVNQNLIECFLNKVQSAETCCFYGFMTEFFITPRPIYS